MGDGPYANSVASADCGRCFAVTGDVWSGNRFCGNPAKSVDVNGRPVCGVHKKGQPGIAWYGDRYRYPEGTGGEWKWSRGEFR